MITPESEESVIYEKYQYGFDFISVRLVKLTKSAVKIGTSVES